MAIGAYVSAGLAMWQEPWKLAQSVPGEHVLLLGSLIAGGGAAAIAGVIVGLPSLRLRGDYLAIRDARLRRDHPRLAREHAVARRFARDLDAGDRDRRRRGVDLGRRGDHGAVGGAPQRLDARTRDALGAGRRDRGGGDGREHHAAEGPGVRARGVLAGVAGALFAHEELYLNPKSFTFLRSIEVVAMVVLGGMGSISGSVLAGIGLAILPEALRPLQRITGTDLRMILYGLLLILVCILRPSGLFGQAEITRFWAERRRWFTRKAAA